MKFEVDTDISAGQLKTLKSDDGSETLEIRVEGPYMVTLGISSLPEMKNWNGESIKMLTNPYTKNLGNGHFLKIYNSSK
ncbi:hypothetical protein [Tetragenococcus halophilus]|uniref:Uncharacterized protein n=1 Tax=Tetragenococcus halophilus (strain DSM 20338 / JCM 20259 / NCIMB 9735 / NBRC 12172) TaxID=945021 RepID=A0AAN1SGT4_TETHN|nr:hypothetical protein [Tetragenococcus halophilus]BAK94184.1 hypothetical protein TEH_08570 [Tetragenococcus halophilus NBRC 12172]GBD70767.1 putative uncharacterized protein [Tetragenococcus halophilus subsp. halophilus]